MAGANKPIWPRVPSGFVKGQLLAHKLLGLTLAAVMYLVCLTGAIAVFYSEFERWEKPAVPEMQYASPEAIGRAAAYVRQDIATRSEKPADVFIVPPSSEMPRLVADFEGGEAMAFDESGAYAGPAVHDLTHFLLEMHYALNLPWQVGFIVVGILGVLLTALIVGGALALPRMFRDAFTLRLDGGRRLSRVDLHNRLAVWGLPFHLIVAISGALMGVALVLLSLATPIMFGGDSLKAMQVIYGDSAGQAARARAASGAGLAPDARVTAALTTLARERPNNPPLYIALNQYGTPDETVSIGAAHKDRLIYSEIYQFDTQGRLMDQAGYSNGALGRQLHASMFRVHAGAFGGLWVKLLYAALGLALAFICTTGVDIWLAKANTRSQVYDRVQSAWTCFVWAVPALIGAASTLSLAFNAPPVLVFWLALLAVSIAGVWIPQRFAHWFGPLAAGACVLSLPSAHVLRFGADALTGAGLAVNAGLALSATLMIALALRNRAKAAAAAPAATAQAPAAS